MDGGDLIPRNEFIGSEDIGVKNISLKDNFIIFYRKNLDKLAKSLNEEELKRILILTEELKRKWESYRGDT